MIFPFFSFHFCRDRWFCFYRFGRTKWAFSLMEDSGVPIIIIFCIYLVLRWLAALFDLFYSISLFGGLRSEEKTQSFLLGIDDFGWVVITFLVESQHVCSSYLGVLDLGSGDYLRSLRQISVTRCCQNDISVNGHRRLADGHELSPWTHQLVDVVPCVVFPDLVCSSACMFLSALCKKREGLSTFGRDACS